MKREYKPGAHVIFVNSHGKPQNALVTVFWDGGMDYNSEDYEGQEPCLNLTIVSLDEKKDDQYGRQIERNNTSIVHRTSQTAHGFYWCWPDEYKGM